MLKVIKSLFRPLPSFFDLCLGGFLVIPYLRDDWNKGTFIVFYAAFLVALSLSMKPKREYRSLPLVLLTVWSLINAFIHSYEVSSYSITFKYPNYCLMLEGFLYVLFGILFVITVVRYSTNLRYIFFLLPIAILPWYNGIVRVGSTTPVAALCIAIVVYLYMSKRTRLAILATILGIAGVIWQWSWICMKWACRPMVLHQLATNVVYRPVRFIDGQIIDPGVQLSPALEKILKEYPTLLEAKPWLVNIFGAGFENSVNNKYLWVDKDIFGWVYMQNDFLHLAQCLGPFALILMALFITDCFRKIGKTIYLIPFLAVVLICSFQLTMWKPGLAGIYLLIGAVALAEGIRIKEAI